MAAEAYTFEAKLRYKELFWLQLFRGMIIVRNKMPL